ncbi:MAG TPA: hypothetical protein VJ761_22160 [Ktedonobacteraceae bacterium]|nr:hypothetical protein [Ktedonobacteraceae bacterium]
MLLYLLAGQASTSILDNPFFLALLGVIATLVVGFIGAGVAIWIYRKQRSKKIISYQLVSNAPIAIFNKTLQNQVTIQINGQPVHDARQVVLRVSNQGNSAIKPSDFYESITFVFVGSKIVGSDVLDANPPQLMKSIHPTTLVRVGADGVRLEKMLLNANDSITFTLLLEGDFDHLDVSGRIIDGEIIKYVANAFSRESVGELLYEAIKLAIALRF